MNSDLLKCIIFGMCYIVDLYLCYMLEVYRTLTLTSVDIKREQSLNEHCSNAYF